MARAANTNPFQFSEAGYITVHRIQHPRKSSSSQPLIRSSLISVLSWYSYQILPIQRPHHDMFGHPGDEGTHSARKRRRPALSCIECRRRKIKCDRNSPCNHCKQMKNTPCVYKDLHTINPNRRLSGSKGTLTPKLAVDISNEAAGSVPYINGVPYTHELSYRLPSQDSSPQTAPVIYDSSPDNGSSISIATTINEPHTEIVQTLAERLGRSDLDAMTATAEEIDGTRWQKALGLSFSTFNDVIVEDGFPGSKLRTKFFNQTDSTPIRELKGSTSKTRFFGQSHWMNSLDQVGYIPQLVGTYPD
jgi:hypothetical protein